MVLVFRSSLRLWEFYCDWFLYFEISIALYIMMACALTSHQGSMISLRKFSIFSLITSSEATATSVNSWAIILAPLTLLLGTALLKAEKP